MRDLLRTLLRQLGAVVAECGYAQRRVAELRTSLDGYLPAPDRAPDTYQEFLARTGGVLRREPAASRRSAKSAQG